MELDKIKPDKTYKGLPLEEAEKQEVEELIIGKYEEFKKE
jgi:hypothetical protein